MCSGTEAASLLESCWTWKEVARGKFESPRARPWKVQQKYRRRECWEVTAAAAGASGNEDRRGVVEFGSNRMSRGKVTRGRRDLWWRRLPRHSQ